MKKKTLMITATTLIVLLLSPPIAYAGVVHYWWDNVYFVEGTDIDYPHPDNVYYGISPSSDWTRLGNNLYHNQINRDTSYAIEIGIAIFIDIVILILSAKLGGSLAASYVAGLVGIVISTVISMIIDYFFVDERGCIWWWISWLFVYYLLQNLQYLFGALQTVALAAITAAFFSYGYFRVGMVTFNDPMGIGSPSYTLTISATSGGTTSPAPGTYTCGSGYSVTVTASAYSSYTFSYWVLDGAIVYGNPTTVTMNSDHTLQAHFTHRGGGGCPFVSVWDGNGYMLDNNVLPRSELSNRTDVEDYYRLEQTVSPKNGKYAFILSEFENEHSYFDKTQLLAVDHESDVNIAITPNGEILTYKNPVAPSSAIDDNGVDRLNEIRLMDGNVSDPTTFFQGYPSDYLVLSFGQVNSANAKLILRDDQKKVDEQCILVQFWNSSYEWQTVDVVVPRAYWSTEAVNLSPYVVQGQELLVRLYWQEPHRLDYLGLDTTPQANYEIHRGNLVSAIHSTQGDVRAQLAQNDNVYAELVPGERIRLVFRLRDETRQARTFILYTKGHYQTITP